MKAWALDCRNAVANDRVNGTLQSKPGGGVSYNLQNVVIVANSSGGDVAGTLDSSCGNGQVARQGVEREFVVVAYGISSYDSNAMKSQNPHSGIYEAETSRTLDLNGGNPACNQGGC